MPSDKSAPLATLHDLRREIDRAIEDYFTSGVENILPENAKHSKDAFKKLKEFSMRPGKRIRGALCVIAYEAQGGKNHSAAIQAAVAMELVQNYLLIVDDVMDRSAMRRGGPTVHVQYSNDLKNTDLPDEKNDHVSNMLGINVGLLSQHLAAKLMLDVKEEPPRVQKANSNMHQNIFITGCGQIEDLFGDMVGGENTTDITMIHRLKTSYYTFINPLQTGALLAGAEDNVLQAIEDFGVPAGIAFQLYDDIIGLFGDDTVTGKSVVDDLREGKMTLMVQHSLANGTKEDIKMIRSVLGNPDASPDQHKLVKNILQKNGSVSYTKDQALEYADQARHLIDELGWPDQSRLFLKTIIDYITKRDK